MHVPERIVAVWLRSGTGHSAWKAGEIAVPEIPSAAYDVPVMANPGLKEKGHERFRRAWDGLKAMQAEYREAGAPFFAFAPDPRTGHECGDSRYLAIPFFDFWLAHRLPEAEGEPLKPAAPAVPAWEKQLAAKTSEYIETGAVADDTPPPAPSNVQVARRGDAKVVTWEAEADVESGIRAFLIERNGKQIGQTPDRPIGRFGRELFQTMSYHDTPEAPLPKLEFIDETAGDGDAVYAVRTVNSVGLKSEATKSE